MQGDSSSLLVRGSSSLSKKYTSLLLQDSDSQGVDWKGRADKERSLASLGFSVQSSCLFSSTSLWRICCNDKDFVLSDAGWVLRTGYTKCLKVLIFSRNPT
jgi:hypothetical protein